MRIKNKGTNRKKKMINKIYNSIILQVLASDFNAQIAFDYYKLRKAVVTGEIDEGLVYHPVFHTSAYYVLKKHDLLSYDALEKKIKEKLGKYYDEIYAEYDKKENAIIKEEKRKKRLLNVGMGIILKRPGI